MSDQPLISLFNCDDGSWEKYAKTAEFLEFISPMEGQELSTGNTKVFAKDLPFYNGVRILQTATMLYEDEPTYYFFLEYNGDYVLLRGLSDAIHAHLFHCLFDLKFII